MANILFKRGLQADLNTIISNKTAVDGTFYLTTDSNRLYVGTADKIAVPVNEGVNKVSDMDTLKAKTAYGSVNYGDFYYVMDKNILAIYGEDGWTQINPDTNVYVTGVDVAVSVANGEASLTTVITNNNGSQVSDATPITIKGTGGVTLTKDDADNALVIGVELPDTVAYEITTPVSSDGAAIKLVPSIGNETSIALNGGTNVTVAAEKDAITISAKDTTYSDLALSTPAQGIGISLKQSDGEILGNTIDPTISFDTHTIHFENGNANLNTALTEYINKLIGEELKDANAMTYRGAVDSENPLPTTGVKLGDTYLVNTTSYELPDGSFAKQGDLLIASGGSEVDGVITSGLTWTLVESGDEVDTTYTATSNTGNKTLEIKDSHGATMTLLEVDQKDDTNPVKVTMEADSSNKARWIVEHEEVAVSADDENTSAIEISTNAFKFNAVSNVEVNDYGHVTGYQVTEYTVSGFRPSLDSSTGLNATEATGGGAALNMAVAMNHGGEKYSTDESAVNIIGDEESSVTVGVESGNVVIGLAWGTF